MVLILYIMGPWWYNRILPRYVKMINVTKLYCGGSFGGDALRYPEQAAGAPVVVWNCTSQCNLRCDHCYSDARAQPLSDELSTGEAKALLSGLAKYGVPVVLFSGGEPLMRNDIHELGAAARALGMRAVLSTNGTMIGRDEAAALLASGFEYAGVSLDGLGEVNDRFRGVRGAFQKAKDALGHCRNAGMKTGVRMTLTSRNAAQLESVVRFTRKEGVKRFCLYHLVYAGRGSSMEKDDVGREEARGLMDLVMGLAKEFYREDPSFEILTVDNHADGVYIYRRLLDENRRRAGEALGLLKKSGGNRSGIAIACVDARGFVYADQFMRQLPLGNVRERTFAEIWGDPFNELLAALRERKTLLKGKCGRCLWQDVCNGNMRARALAVYGDLWAEDPACYLTEEEITGRQETVGSRQ
jgi:radical SAM protein with 4Fe4S-binding SPASM domain